MRSIVLSTLILVLSMSAHGRSRGRSLTLGELTRSFSVERSQKLPVAISGETLTDIQLKKDSVRFQYQNRRFHIKVVRTEPLVLEVNGKRFSAVELRSDREISRSLHRKFGVPRTQFTWLSLVLPELFAEVERVALFPEDYDSVETAAPQASNMDQFRSGTSSTDLTDTYNFVSGGGDLKRIMMILSSFIGTVSDFVTNDRVFNSFGNFGSPDAIDKPYFGESVI